MKERVKVYCDAGLRVGVKGIDFDCLEILASVYYSLQLRIIKEGNIHILKERQAAEKVGYSRA